MSATNSNYVDEVLPPWVIQKLEAGAFQSLCSHLQERSDEVQNIDLMTVSGFCRNCLAKWLVVEARKLSDAIKADENVVGDTSQTKESVDQITHTLDALGYDEAAGYVYGMEYPEWKKRHAKNATDEQMERYNQSQHMWAPHEKDVLAKQAEGPVQKMNTDGAKSTNSQQGESRGGSNELRSNVCCQDVDDDATPNVVKSPIVENSTKANANKANRSSRELPPYNSPTSPTVSFSLGILTVSDRAFSGEYASGDLSGPAVQRAVEAAVGSYGSNVVLSSTEVCIVPDESDAIQSKLKEWADNRQCDLILTTGGTGFSPRDVTPEATKAVVTKTCEGLVSFCTLECTKSQALASLSRGTAGVRGETLIVNLPGNPKGVDEIIPVLLPLALHAVADIKASS